MICGRSATRITLVSALVVFFGVTTAIAAAPVAHDRVLPELDRRVPAVLDMISRELALAPPPQGFATEAEFKIALAKLGDVAYEDADNGLLFVASGFAVSLGLVTPTADVLRTLEGKLESRDFLKGAELNPGTWFAVRIRNGEIVLGRVVARSAREIQLSWGRGENTSQGYTMEWVDVIAAAGPPAIATARIPPLDVQRPVPLTNPEGAQPPRSKNVLHLSNGQFSVGPELSSVFSAKKMGPLVARVHAAGDLAYARHGTGMLVIASGKAARLGQGPVRFLAGRDLRPRLQPISLLSASEIAPGNAFFIETTQGHHALVRVDGLTDEGVEITWVTQADGSGSFSDLTAFDASYPIPSQNELDRRLLVAATRGDINVMAYLLGFGANANTTTGRGGRSPLMHAVIKGDARAIEFLLQSGADPNAQGEDGWNALHAAAKLGRADLVKALLEAGADPRTMTEDGQDALAIAVGATRQDVGVIATLRRVSGDADSLALAARVGDLKAITSMLELGNDVNAKDEAGRTALHIAATSGQTEVLLALLEAGADPGLESNRHGSALAAAARAGQGEVVVALLENGENSEVQKASALYAANQRRDPELVRVLLSHGADPVIGDGSDMPPLEHALQYGSEALVDVYVDAGHPLTVSAAARLGRAEELEKMLLSGADLSQRSPAGAAPIGEAIRNEHLEAVRVILDQGGNANAPLPTWDRKSPLHVAAEAKRSDVASLLLDRGADPNALDASGRSPLYDAVVLGREDNVRVLLERGADPNLAPPGDTTLRAARAESLRKLLRDYGARD